MSDPAIAPSPQPSPPSAAPVAAAQPPAALTTAGRLEASRRAAVLRAVADAMQELRVTHRQACARVGASQATVSRWEAQRAALGEAGLAPGYGRSGRRSVLEEYLSAEDAEWFSKRVRELTLRTGSMRLAARLAAEEERCPAPLRAHIMGARRIPRSVLRAASVTEELRNWRRGPRAYQLAGTWTQRDMTEVLPSGERVQVQPGDWWEMDDMSVNQPFWFEVGKSADCADCADYAEEAQRERGMTVEGIALGRQGLFALDVASGKWLGHLLVGRPRDAYRAEDILRYMRLLFETHGKPRRGLRLERGVWRSRRLRGSKLTAMAEQGLSGPEWEDVYYDSEGLDGELQQALAAGLAELGLEVRYCYSPHTKGFIEGAFDFLQKLMSTRDLADIGRTRGENEAATRGLVSAKGGHSHPAARGFGHISEVSAALEWAENWVNTHEKRGRLHQGVPDEKWAASVSAAPLSALGADERAVFLPERRELQLRGGYVTPTVDGQPLPFAAPELFAELGAGYRLLVAFDPSDLSLGMGLWNADLSSANRRGWRLGQWIGWAQYQAPAPQFGRPAREGTESAERIPGENRRRYQNWHRTEFAALAGQPQRAQSTQSTQRESAVRDGRGNVGVRNAECGVRSGGGVDGADRMDRINRMDRGRLGGRGVLRELAEQGRGLREMVEVS